MIRRLSRVRHDWTPQNRFGNSRFPWDVRVPPPPPIQLRAAWPRNATSEHLSDPLWISVLQREGFEAVRRRIDAQLRGETEETR